MGKLVRAALLLALLVLLTTTAFAEGDTVTSLKTDCQVETDGACTLTMEITLDLASGTERFSIPVSPAARDLSCSVPYTLAEGDGCRLLQLSGLRAGKTELTVSYRLAETVTDDGSSQNFAVQLLYPAWSCPISAYEVTIRLPGSFSSMPVFLSGYYGDLIDNYMIITIEEGTVLAGAYAMILGIDAILDMGRTALNVFGDLTCTCCVAKRLKYLREDAAIK